MLTKPIEAGQTHIDLYKSDLLAEAQKAFRTDTHTKMAKGSEEVPWHVFLGHEWEGHSFEELVILTSDPTKAVPKSKGSDAKTEAKVESK